MYKKTITYSDYSDKPQEITETFFFDLTIIELIEKGWAEGELERMLNVAIDHNKLADMVSLFKEIVMASYGIRSSDRKSFIKDPEATAKFMNSKAYSVMLEEIIGDSKGKYLQDFILGILPKIVNGQKLDYDSAIKQARKEAYERFGIEEKESGEIEVVDDNDTED